MLRVPVDHLEPGEQSLSSRSARYVLRVHRVAPGERIVLFDAVRAEQAVAEVLETGRHGVVCRVETVERAPRRTSRSVVLLQAIGKGDKFDAIVRDATELGATRIVALETARAVVRLGQRATARLDRWRRIAVEAARQAGRGDAPLVEGPLGWAEALDSVPQGVCRICMWEGSVEPLGRRIAGLGQRPVAVAVGPEGGLEPHEVDFARDAGFALLSLGPFVLRTETVAPAVLGALLVQGQMEALECPDGGLA